MALVNWHDSLQSVDVLTDPNATKIVADQLQKQAGTPRVADLSEAIADIIIETAVQGASILEVHIIDPWLQLLSSRFIDVDDAGLLLPIEVNYPDGTDCFWWLAAIDAQSAEQGSANLVLTFEDKNVAEMRDHGGPGERKISRPGETRAEFIAELVGAVKGVRFWSPSMQQELAAGKFVGVGDAIYTGTLNPVQSPPASSTQPGASPQRRNPTKSSRGSGRDATPQQRAAQQAANAAIQGAGQAASGLLNLLGPPATAPNAGGTGGSGNLATGG